MCVLGYTGTVIPTSSPDENCAVMCLVVPITGLEHSPSLVLYHLTRRELSLGSWLCPVALLTMSVDLGTLEESKPEIVWEDGRI
jgi:hypothetical protein